MASLTAIAINVISNNSNEFTETLQTGQAQDCIKYQCDQCGHETTVTERK